MNYLLIAEKPSLMRDIQSCYRKHKVELQNKLGTIDFISLSGHVCTNYAPDDYEMWKSEKWEDIQYPMVPDSWGIKPIDDDYKKKTISSIKSKIKNHDGVIVATDSDVEGYGIYFLLEHYLQMQEIPALRFIEHSLTDKEILNSLLSMTDYHKDPVHVRFTQSFLVRSRADWLFGFNASRMLSTKERRVMRVGRVKAPTIKLIYDNSVAIENFKSRKYFTLNANYGTFSATLLDDNGTIAQFDTTSQIPDVPLDGRIKKKETKRTTEHAPKLFDLTSAQAEAGRIFKFSPAHTLDIIQSLYEKHKVISYPRTQCRYVSTEKAKEFKMMLSHMSVFNDLAPIAKTLDDGKIKNILNDKQVVNDAEVQKESHDALLPTSNRPDLSAMTEDEKKICHMIFKRLLAQFMNKLTEDKTELLILHGERTFSAKGKIVVDPGWSVLYMKNAKDSVIPPVEKGDLITAKSILPQEKNTTPPKRLTQTTLINAMQNIASQIEDKELKKSLADSKGIGTPATRASIISEILKAGYAEERKNGLYITQAGKDYIKCVESLDITYPVFAAQLDTEMKKVQRGEADFQMVMNRIIQELKNMCSQIGKLEQKSYQAESTDSQCPICKTTLVNQKYSYSCPKCGWKISKNICGKEIDEKLLKLLLAGKTSPQFSLKKKDGTSFKSCLKLGDDGKVVFSSGITCPLCGRDARLNRGGIFCDCGLKVYRNCAGYTFSDSELKKLVTKRKLSVISDFKKKNGENFAAEVILNDDGTTKLNYVD